MPRPIAEVLKEFNHIKPTHFRSTSGNASETARQWKNYINRFENIFEILSLKDEDDATKVKLLQAHEYDIVRKATASVDDTQVAAQSGVYKKLIRKLELYYQVPTLEEYARNKLTSITQKDGQTASDLLVEIKELIADAGWNAASNVNDQTKTILLKALKSEAVRQQYRFSLMHGKTELSLSAIVEVANVIERSAVTNQRHNAPDPLVQAVRHYQPRQFRQQGNQQRNSYQGRNQNQPQRRCFGCGSGQHRSNKDPKCPARDVTCHGCSKKGHFQKHCRSGGNASSSSHKNPRSYNKNKYSKKKQFVRKVEYESAQSASASAGPSIDSKVDSLQADLAQQIFF